MKPSHSLTRTIFSDLTEVDFVCQDARKLLETLSLIQHGFSVELLLREFLNNAMIHGNGLDAHKQVRVLFQIGIKWIRIQIADEGPGFNWRKARRTPPDPDAESGRGLAIAMIYAHRVRFNRIGNQVTIWIKKTDE